MEAGQPPPPPPGQQPPRPGQLPPGQAPSRPPSDRAGAVPRIGVALLVLLFLFAGAVMIAVSLDLGEGPRCEQVFAGEEPPDEDGKCLDASKTAQTISVVLVFLSGIAAAVVVLAGIAFVIRGRGGRLVAIAAAAAIVLGGLGILIG